MRALVIKELPDISIYTVLSGSISGELFLSEDLKIGARLQDVIIEGAQWEIVKAASEGKEIEIFTSRGWETKIHKEWYNQFYRIAPEPPKPKYVPFTADDWELFTARPVKINPLVKNSESDYVFLITGWNDTGARGGSDIYQPYQAAFDKFIFLDGTPFGKLQQ